MLRKSASRGRGDERDHLEHEREEWLQGKAPAQIVCIVISGQGRRATCTDPATLAYLSRLLSPIKNDYPGGGVVYEAVFSLGDGRTIRAELDLSPEGMMVGQPGDEIVLKDQLFSSTLFPNPVPPKLKEIMGFLLADKPAGVRAY